MKRPDRPRGLRHLLESLLTAALPLLLRLLARTWSFRILNRRVLEEFIDAGRPVIAATWHQMIVPGVVFFRDRRAVVMVSRSRDGERIARVGRRLGFRSARGSSSRGGAEALIELIDHVRRGGQAAMMVDGPRGPAREPKPGVVVAAAHSGAPIVPVGCRARPGWLAPNWDRTLVPFPFARIVLSLGDPIEVPSGAGPEELESYRRKVHEDLLAAEAEAERYLKR